MAFAILNDVGMGFLDVIEGKAVERGMPPWVVLPCTYAVGRQDRARYDASGAAVTLDGRGELLMTVPIKQLQCALEALAREDCRDDARVALAVLRSIEEADRRCPGRYSALVGFWAG